MKRDLGYMRAVKVVLGGLREAPVVRAVPAVEVRYA
jgi:hypothetical protein